MKLTFRTANETDAPDIALLRNAAAQKLTEQFGPGYWSGNCTESGVLLAMRNGLVLVAHKGRRIVGTLTLATKKPWAIDPAYFVKSKKPYYLTNMAVGPDAQRTGVGHALVDAAKVFVQKEGGDAIRLDAWEAKAGAGPFYAKCGFQEVGRVVYRNAPLIYYELLLR